ncbi:hypothetical protein [Psychromonas sp. KJ10-2]|uniref:hypothetical protein n=1 Tax=Psychromonas sp. KJ10-2 TaxID=3391822 RepID=UPI0039B55B44
MKIEIMISKTLYDSLNQIDLSVRLEEHPNDVLYSQSFTAKVNDYLETLNEADHNEVLSYLSDPLSSFKYAKDTHNYSLQKFNSNGICYHGLTAGTCPCGCSEWMI